MSQLNAFFAESLPAYYYYSNDHYQIEFNKIFKKEWIYILHESQLPEIGSYETFEIGNIPILITRDSTNEIKAFYNVCIHRGHILTEGRGRKNTFVCPYHNWTYSNDGLLSKAPKIDTNKIPACRKSLTAIEVYNKEGFIFIRIEKSSNNFEDRYGVFFEELKNTAPFLKNLKFTRRFTAEVNGNWKIMVENYLECYHCTPTHKALSELMQIKNFKIKQYDYFLSTTAPAGLSINSAYNYTTKNNNQKNFNGWGLWPNLTFNIFPGQDNLLIFYMIPISSEKTIGYCDYFFINGEINEEAESLMKWESEILEKEDDNLIISTHKGIKSGAIKSAIFLTDENNHSITESPLYHFNKLIKKSLDN